jgi:hypothetical protein
MSRRVRRDQVVPVAQFLVGNIEQQILAPRIIFAYRLCKVSASSSRELALRAAKLFEQKEVPWNFRRLKNGFGARLMNCGRRMEVWRDVRTSIGGKLEK